MIRINTNMVVLDNYTDIDTANDILIYIIILARTKRLIVNQIRKKHKCHNLIIENKQKQTK